MTGRKYDTQPVMNVLPVEKTKAITETRITMTAKMKKMMAEDATSLL